MAGGMIDDSFIDIPDMPEKPRPNRIRWTADDTPLERMTARYKASQRESDIANNAMAKRELGNRQSSSGKITQAAPKATEVAKPKAKVAETTTKTTVAKETPKTKTSDFGAAFAAARKKAGGGNGVFEFNGKKYTTKIKGEK